MTKRNQRKNGRPVTYWHGGAPGLKIGALLRPPTKDVIANLGFTSRDEQIGDDRPYAGNVDRVYVTTDRALATAFAFTYKHVAGDGNTVLRRGDLYEVEPVGKILPDPDFPPTSYECRAAKIVRAVERDVVMTAEARGKAMSPYQRYQADVPLYDDDGYLNLSDKMSAEGWAKPELAALFGAWPDPAVITIPPREFYDAAGYLLPTESMLSAGITASFLVEYGAWRHPDDVREQLQRRVARRPPK